jgi:hypothetical protein
MFTLIHLARDNGLNLYFCKVEQNELMEVARPAIFHQKNHFVFVDDGEALPPGDYDGYVLTPRPYHEPLPYTLAKKIRGQKKIGGMLQPIITGIASVINPVLGAVVGAGFGAARAAGAFGPEGKGEWWRIATGGISGALGAKSPGLSAISAAVGELPGAIKNKNYLAPIAAGLGQYGANIGVGGFSSGFSSAAPGASFLSKLGSGMTGTLKAFTGGASRLAGGSGPGGGVEIGRSAIGATPSGYSGSVTVPGVGGMSLAGARSLASGASGTSGGFGIPGLSGTKLLGLGASALLKPPQLQGNVTDNYAKAAQYLGVDNYKGLPSATREQLNKYIGMPLNDLAQQFYAPDDKGLRMIQESKQKEIDAIATQYANYGQDPYTSSEAQQRLTEINRQYDQAAAEYQQQIQNQAMAQAVKFKQEILQTSIQQGQFDYNAAMELATYIGRDQEMRYAMETKNYDMLQDLLVDIFQIGR